MSTIETDLSLHDRRAWSYCPIDHRNGNFGFTHFATSFGLGLSWDNGRASEKPPRLTEADITRRIDFILQEARYGLARRDQTITYAMRTISSFYAVGHDMSSSAAKLRCRRMSLEAWRLRKSLSSKEWTERTINEHQQPLKQLWDWIVENKHIATAESVADHFKKYLMVTVTKDEDARLRLLHKETPEKRYEIAKITILERPASGNWDHYQGDTAS